MKKWSNKFKNINIKTINNNKLFKNKSLLDLLKYYHWKNSNKKKLNKNKFLK